MKIDGREIIVCCPSYLRSSHVETLDYLPSTRVYVAEKELTAYRSSNRGADIEAMPDETQGNIARVRNWVLDKHRKDVVCIIDDDLRNIGYFEKGQRVPLRSEKEVMAFLWKHTRLALDLGVTLWGINVNFDSQVYREYTPFSMVSYIGSPFMVHLSPSVRFDERLPLKEDYDFCLQTLNLHRKILRVNKFYYVVRQAEQAGGCSESRSIEFEKEQFRLLQKKWGSDIVRSDSLSNSRNHRTTKIRKVDINPVIQVPIAGI